MTRETSIEAYHAIVKEGLLGKMQEHALLAVVNYGPCTSAEAFEHLRGNRIYDNPIVQSRARFTELRNMGVIQEKGQRRCKITGRTAIVWEFTGNKPTRKSTKKRIFWIVEQGSGGLFPEHKAFEAKHHAEAFVAQNGGDLIESKEVVR